MYIVVTFRKFSSILLDFYINFLRNINTLSFTLLYRHSLIDIFTHIVTLQLMYINILPLFSWYFLWLSAKISFIQFVILLCTSYKNFNVHQILFHVRIFFLGGGGRTRSTPPPKKGVSTWRLSRTSGRKEILKLT